jgi:copper chaperone CopZ
LFVNAVRQQIKKITTMKNFLLKFAKVTGFLVLTFFVSMLVWANWEEPPLSDKLDLKPINLAVFDLNKDIDASDSTLISNKLSATSGVTACTVNPKFKTVSVTFYGDQVSEDALKSVVQQKDYVASKINFATMEGPKCPVPMEYINFFTDMKKTLCLR